MNRFQTITAGAALAALVSVPALADYDSGWYIGASANWLSADDINVTDADFDDSDTAYGFKGGYMFTDLLGIEGGYMDLGSYQALGNEEGNNLNLDAEGWYVAGILNFSFAESLRTETVNYVPGTNCKGCPKYVPRRLWRPREDSNLRPAA